MRKTLVAVLSALLFMGGASFAFADVDPTIPQPFTFTCEPYSSPFLGAHAYTPTVGGNCTFTLPFDPAFLKLSEIYKGVVGSSTLLNYRLAIFDPSEIYDLTYVNAPGDTPQPGDAFFAAAYAGNDVSGDAYLQTGAGTAPETLQVVSWFWGAPLVIHPDNKTSNAGVALPFFTYTFTGLIGTDTQASNGITGSATCTTTATIASPVGDYPITCTPGTLASTKYSFLESTPATLHIVTPPQSPLTVTANNASKVSGSALPPLTASLSGFVNGDTPLSNDVTGAASCTTTATPASPAGTYPITCTIGTLTSTNYSFNTFVAGTLTVTPPPPPPTRVCLWALSPTASGLQMSGSGSIKGVNCGTQINSSNSSAVSLTGSANVNTPSNCVVGGVKKTGSSSFTTAPLSQCTSKADPFASIAKPVVPATCNFTNYSQSGSSAVTLQPGVYCGGIKFSGSSKVTFAPGIYILKNGPLSVSGSGQLTGTGVSFFLTGTNAGVNASGSGTWHLVAPTSGLLAGFVFYLDGSSSGISASSQFSGSSDLYFEGVVYLPKQTLQVSGSNKTSASSPFTSIIANAFQMSGSGVFTLNGLSSPVPAPAGLFVTN